jgi:sodium/potassium-transporting ATPase subunit alpha
MVGLQSMPSHRKNSEKLYLPIFRLNARRGATACETKRRVVVWIPTVQPHHHSRGISLISSFFPTGPNELSIETIAPGWLRFLRHFGGLFPLLLEISGALYLVAYLLETSQPGGAQTNNNLYLGIALLFVVVATATFAFLQESKAKATAAGFNRMSTPHCVVIRHSERQVIRARNAVKGDVLSVQAGDKIAADLIFFETTDLKVNNFLISGEIEPQIRSNRCTHPLFLKSENVGFFGTVVEEGSGYGVVIRTGDETYVGHIAEGLRRGKTNTRLLQKEISRFVRIITIIALVLGIVFLIASFVIDFSVWISDLVYVIGIIVANVPEGLLPTVTVALTLTAKRLAKKNVLVKDYEAIETLGSCSTICSDKTGTLTQNVMTVRHCCYDGQIKSLDELATLGGIDRNDQTFKLLFLVAALCGNAVFHPNPDNLELPIQQRLCIGDASETAILKFCEKFRRVDKFKRHHPKVFEIPFTSHNKWQLSVHSSEHDKAFYIVVKGAPERVALRCTTILLDGKQIRFGSSQKRKFDQAYRSIASNGERCFAMAFKVILWSDLKRGKETRFALHSIEFETDFTLVGLIGLQDPPRPEVKDAVEDCQTAGIRVVMVTGDHAFTAAAVAREVGIIRGQTLNQVAAKSGGRSWRDVDPDSAGAVIVTGSEIHELSEDEWETVLSKSEIVFARTSPEQKLQIVERFQARGEITAVTGDGVNDSPALKKADLGCAMGIAGSDVSKDSAVVVLMDDNFASIVVGVREGRIIFDNLKKSIAYTLSSNSAELLPFIAYFALQMPQALSAILILSIDLGTDLLPAISLAYESAESNIMYKPPRNPKKHRLVGFPLAVYSYVWLGMWQAIAGFLGYFTVFWNLGISSKDILWTSFEYWKPDAPDFHAGGRVFSETDQLDILHSAQSSFFISLVIVRIACVFVCKTRSSSLFSSLPNKILWIAILLEIILAASIVNIPGVTSLFGTGGVGWEPCVIGITFAAGLIVAEEIRKLLIRRGYLKWTYW